MAVQPSPARLSLSALLPILIGNLVVVSSIAIPLLPASISTQEGRYASYGPVFTLFSGWQILTSPRTWHVGPVNTYLVGESYFTLVPVALALLALLVLLWALLTHAAPAWLKLYRALAIIGVLILFLANVLAAIYDQGAPENAVALGAALALLYAAFLAMILGSTRALRQWHS